MTERLSETASAPPSTYAPPASRETTITHGRTRYDVEAAWTVLRKREKPAAEMFSVSYLSQTKKDDRPITFVFNGGPGAASAFLHVGAMGPRRVVFGKDGALPATPVTLADNAESWLPFTDLVFVDPIGTGFSRVIEDEQPGGKQPEGHKTDPNEFFQIHRDLDSLGEFMQRFLSRHKRWGAPVFIAGESYGGYRVARMIRRIPERFGIGLKGAFLISPAIELSVLDFTDYNVVPYVNVFSALAATACFHKRIRGGVKELANVCSKAERFAVERLPRALVEGAALPTGLAREFREEMSSLCGLSDALLERLLFKVSPYRFQRELLRDAGRFCGMYDGSLTALDPFPDRDTYQGPDPTFQGIDRVFTTGANMLIRDILGVSTDRSYHLLSEEVYTNWKVDVPRSFLQTELGATDDLRYGLALNADLQVMIVHGYFDLITPSFASRRLLDGVRLDPSERARVSFATYLGGHMFYSWDESRKRFTSAAQKMYR